MDLHQPTWLTLYSLSLDFPGDNACARHRPQHWLYHHTVKSLYSITFVIKLLAKWYKSCIK